MMDKGSETLSDLLKIFISSKMRRRVLEAERLIARDTIKDLNFARPWMWEEDAPAGPCCAMGLCLENVRTSDGLVLILGHDLTQNTRREYEEAEKNRVPVFMFVKEGRLKDETRKFVDEKRQLVTYRQFGNISELKSWITKSLISFFVHNAREGARIYMEERWLSLRVGSSVPRTKWG
jgi:hypothetical protein